MQTKIKITLIFALLIMSVGGYYLTRKNNYSSKDEQNQPVDVKGTQEINPPVDSEEPKERVASIIQLGDFSQCEKLEDQTYRNVCKNNIALKLAEEKADPAFCQNLDNVSFLISDCEAQIVDKVSVAQEKISICDKAADKQIAENCRKQYWKQLATEKNDITICDGAAEDKIACQNEVIFKNEFEKDVNGFDCSKFVEDSLKTDCEVIKKDGRKGCQNFLSPIFSQYCANLMINGN